MLDAVGTPQFADALVVSTFRERYTNEITGTGFAAMWLQTRRRSGQLGST